MTTDDLLADLLPPEYPAAFDALSEADQTWRGRVFLMTWSLIGNEAFSWDVALHDELLHNTEMKALVAQADDELIRATVESRMAAEQGTHDLGSSDMVAPSPSPQTETPLWDKLVAESRGQPQPSRVSLLVPPHRAGGDREPA